MKWQLSTKWGERFFRTQAKVYRSLNQLWINQHYRRKLLACPFCIIGIFILFSWTIQSNSCAFHAFFAIILFDVITLVGDLISQTWITGKPCSTSFSFGYVRVEVLTHFSVICLGLLLNCWAIKKSLELILGSSPDQEIHTGRFIPGAVGGGLIHFFLSFNNSPFLKVYKVSSTTTSLQKYFQGICASFGLSLSSASTFALSPLAILGAFSSCTVVLLAFELQTGPGWFDFVGGILIILAVFDALCPLAVYTAQVLLQTVPAHIVAQLEKSLREALTIDDVLEFRNELFWTLTYGQIAGTLHVRVRRDANEQLVLSRVYDKLQPLAPHLTVQVTKDDFGRQFGNLHILRDLDSLTQVTVNHSTNHNSELSPIPTAGNANHLIYTSSTRTHNPVPPYGQGPGISSTPRFNESSFSNVQTQRSVLSSTDVVDSDTLNGNVNQLIEPLVRANLTSTVSPFVINGTSGSNNPYNQNLLMSSANYFPE